MYSSPVAWCSALSCADYTTQLQFTWDGHIYTMCDNGACELDAWTLDWTDTETDCHWVGVQSGSSLDITITGPDCVAYAAVPAPTVEMSSIPSSSCSSECCPSVASPVPAGVIPDSAWQFTGYGDDYDCYVDQATACIYAGYGGVVYHFEYGGNECWALTGDPAWALMQLEYNLTESPLGCKAVTSILGKIPGGTEGTIYLQDHGGIADCWSQTYFAPTPTVTQHSCDLTYYHKVTYFSDSECTTQIFPDEGCYYLCNSDPTDYGDTCICNGTEPDCPNWIHNNIIGVYEGPDCGGRPTGFMTCGPCPYCEKSAVVVYVTLGDGGTCPSNVAEGEYTLYLRRIGVHPSIGLNRCQFQDVDELVSLEVFSEVTNGGIIHCDVGGGFQVRGGTEYCMTGLVTGGTTGLITCSTAGTVTILSWVE